MQIWAEPENRLCPFVYSQILYQFLAFTQNLKRSPPFFRAYFHCFFSSFFILSLAFFCFFLDHIFTVSLALFQILSSPFFQAFSQILSSPFFGSLSQILSSPFFWPYPRSYLHCFLGFIFSFFVSPPCIYRLFYNVTFLTSVFYSPVFILKLKFRPFKKCLINNWMYDAR